MNKQLLVAAREYKKLGISAIPTDSNKRSTIQWKKYQEEIATDEELKNIFNDNRVLGVATLCGKVSGNMEVLDLDCKYDITGSLYEDYIQAVMDTDQAIVPKLVIAKTKGGGYHIMYRCNKIGGNQKIAQRYTTDEEKKDNPHEKVKVLIETRGEAGYVIAVPSPGYEYIQNSIRTLPVIAEPERTILLEAARSFNSVIEEAQPLVPYVETKPMNKSPFIDYNERGDIIGLLQKHGWTVVGSKGDKTVMLRPGKTDSKSSGDYNHKMGLFSVFSTSTEFEENKGYRPSAVLAKLEFKDNWSNMYRFLLGAGYGEPYMHIVRDVSRSVEKYKDAGIVDEFIPIKIANDHNMTLPQAQKVLESYNSAANTEGYFWKWQTRKQELILVHTNFTDFLSENGFGLYFHDKSSQFFKVIHNDHNRLQEASDERIKKFVESYIKATNLDGMPYTCQALRELVYKNSTKLFSDEMYEFLAPLHLDFLKDTESTAYIPFTNGIVQITKDDVKLLKHGEVNKVIWKTDVIDFKVDINQEDDKGCEYMDFITKIVGIESEEEITEEQKEKLDSVFSIIGYLLHKYKSDDNAFAVILAEEAEDEAKGGGTGKGVFIKGLQQILTSVTIDGKNFKPDKTFAYQRVRLDTKLIALQDVERNFNFEKFYSIITEGITIEKKNQDELYLPYEDAPKVIVTTNYGVSDEGEHAKRRQKTIEFSSYFGSKRSPKDVYGHLFFKGWDKDEWNRFYNFMFYCLSFYLQNGIVNRSQGSSYKTKKIKTLFGEEFLSWFEDYKMPGCHNAMKLNNVYQDFLNLHGFDKKDYSMRRFKKALNVSADNFGFILRIRKNTEEKNALFLDMIENRNM